MKSKVIASIIFLLIFAFPARILLFETAAATGAKFVMLMLSIIIGFLVAFGIGTNEPFDRKKVSSNTGAKQGEAGMRKAA